MWKVVGRVRVKRGAKRLRALPLPEVVGKLRLQKRALPMSEVVREVRLKRGTQGLQAVMRLRRATRMLLRSLRTSMRETKVVTN